MIIDLAEDEEAFLYVTMTQSCFFDDLKKMADYRKAQMNFYLIPVIESPDFHSSIVDFSDYTFTYRDQTYLLLGAFPSKNFRPNSPFLPNYEEFAYFSDQRGLKTMPLDQMPSSFPFYVHNVYGSFFFSDKPQNEY